MSRKLRVLVAGSRGFDIYLLLEAMMDKHYGGQDILIVSGGARGADTLAEKYANKHNLEMKVFEAEWSTRGKLAGLIRNTKMVEFCDEALIFWDEQSPGTKDTIKKMKNAGKPFKVITGWTETNLSSSTKQLKL